MEYAKAMFDAKGLRPLIFSNYDLPQGLDKIKVLESILESIEDDIENILNDINLNDDDASDKIIELFNNGNNNPFGDKLEKYKGKKVVVLQSGSADKGKLLVGQHVIPSSVMNKIREDVYSRDSNGNKHKKKIKPNDPKWGTRGDKASTEIRVEIIQDLFDKGVSDRIQTMIDSSTDVNPVDYLTKRIIGNSEGIVDWKTILRNYTKSAKTYNKYKAGGFRKNPASRSGIFLKKRKYINDGFNTLAIYVDTSGSAKSLASAMVSEINGIANSCDFKFMDIHLFTDSVYLNEYGIKSENIGKRDFGLENVRSGMTDLHQVYMNIYKEYILNGRDVDAIIITTDYDGIEDSIITFDESIYKQLAQKGILEKIIYVVYDNHILGRKDEVTNIIKSRISSKSKLVPPIQLDELRKSLKVNENKTISYMINKYKINEALGKKKEKVVRSDDEIKRELDLQVARIDNDVSDFFENQVAAVNKHFPNLKQINSDSGFFDKSKEPAYYIKNDGNMYIRMKIDNSNIDEFIDFLNEDYVMVDILVGDIDLDDCDSFVGFPKKFPKQVIGDVSIFYCDMFKNLANAPEAINGTIEIYSSNRSFQAECNMYAKNVLKHINVPDEHPNFVNMKTNNSEEIQKIIDRRKRLGESYMAEAFQGSLSDLLKRRKGNQIDNIKSQSKRDKAQEEFMRSNANLDVFYNYIQPVADIDWGRTSDDDMTIIDNTKTIKDIIKEPKVFANLNTNAANVWKYNKPGIEMFVDDNDYIRIAYSFDSSKSKKASTLLFIRYKDEVYSGDDAQKFLQERLNLAKKINDGYKSFGVNPQNFKTSKKNGNDDKIYDLEYIAFHVLYYVMVIMNGKTYAGRKSEYSYGIDKIINRSYYQGKNFDTVESILNEIFGFNKWGCDYNRSKFYPDGSHKGRHDDSFFLDQTSNQPIYKNGFINMYKKYYDGSIFNFFTDEFLKFLLVSIAIRKPDNYNVYSPDNINFMDRSKLISSAEELKNVDTYDTLLKAMSYSGFDEGKATLSFDSLLLLPDLYTKCYVYRCDLNTEAIKKIEMGADRSTSRIGTVGSSNNIYDDDMKVLKKQIALLNRQYKDLKDSDSQTDERKAKLIQLKDLINKMLAKKTDYQQNVKNIDDIADEFDELERRGVISKVIDIISNTIDGFEDANKIEQRFAKMKRNINLLSTIDIDPEDTKSVEKLFKSVIKNINIIYKNTSKYNASEYINLITSINDLFDKFAELKNLSNITKKLPDRLKYVYSQRGANDIKSYDDIIDQAISRSGDTETVNRLSDYNRKKRKEKTGPWYKSRQGAVSTPERKRTIADNLTEYISVVNDIIKNVDFDEDLEDVFGTKNAMMNKIEKNLDLVSTSALTILNSDDEKAISSIDGHLNDISNICYSIGNSNEDDLPEKIIQLNNKCVEYKMLIKKLGLYSNSSGRFAV